MSDEAPGTNCTSGGKQVNVGLDVNLSGVLDPAEITSTSYVCNGAAGATGAGGLNSLISSAIEPTGANCPYGGIKTTSGLDSNADGVLDAAEISGTQYVCNGATGPAGATGATGTNGLTTLVSMSDESPGANCSSGGKRVDFGLDVNLSGVLDAAEITSTSYVCNGTAGATGADGATVRRAQAQGRQAQQVRRAPMASTA